MTWGGWGGGGGGGGGRGRGGRGRVILASSAAEKKKEGRREKRQAGRARGGSWAAGAWRPAAGRTRHREPWGEVAFRNFRGEEDDGQEREPSYFEAL